MDAKALTDFKNACREFFATLTLNLLRSYGRALGVYRPTKVNKKTLIEHILSILCGEVAPQYSSRGAPVKHRYYDPSISQEVVRLQKYYLGVETVNNITDQTISETEKEIRVEKVATAVLDKLKVEQTAVLLQFASWYAALTDEQKRLFLAFLKTL